MAKIINFPPPHDPNSQSRAIAAAIAYKNGNVQGAVLSAYNAGYEAGYMAAAKEVEEYMRRVAEEWKLLLERAEKIQKTIREIMGGGKKQVLMP